LFINIHSHRPASPHEWCIQNIHNNFDQLNTLFHYSIGLHPWYIKEESINDELEKLSWIAQKNEVIAIGECGLDRICETPFSFQKNVFIEHIKLANETAKPLIIHCVRAHREILAILKEHPLNVPVIFHGFHNNETIAQQLIEKGYFLSFGHSLFHPSTQKVFSTLPMEHIFLETDDSDKKIEEIYRQSCSIKNISLEQLHLQIHKNYRKIFNAHLL
jgi:TatD DNase family protein